MDRSKIEETDGQMKDRGDIRTDQRQKRQMDRSKTEETDEEQMKDRRDRWTDQR